MLPPPSASGAEKLSQFFGEHRQRVLTALVALGIAGTAASVFLVLNSSHRSAAQVRAAGQALMHSQRMAKSVSAALVGNPAAFAELRESVGTLSDVVTNLRTGEGQLAIAPAAVQPTLESLKPLVERAEKNGKVVQAQEKILTQVGQALRAINRQSSDLLESAEAVSSQALQINASAGEVSAVGQLVMLTQRIGKSANEFLTQEGVSPEAVFLLGKDLNSFKLITEALINGSPELRLNAAKDPQLRERLQTLLKQYEETRTRAKAILDNLQGLVAAREAQTAILNDSEPLRKGLEQAASELEKAGGAGWGLMLLIIASLLALLGGSVGFLRLYLADQSRQAAEQGLAAMQNNIAGMNAIRDSIQETSKRIKRLGESSQEIGE
ncbi:MAG TPA: type IV pili methyl-accepting chemotaxis transducer N-terminal domain-containing protein, partial [Roseateles sp.]